MSQNCGFTTSLRCRQPEFLILLSHTRQALSQSESPSWRRSLNNAYGDRPITNPFSLLTSHSRASGSAGAVLLLQLNLNFIANRLDLLPLPFCTADEIPNEETLE